MLHAVRTEADSSRLEGFHPTFGSIRSPLPSTLSLRTHPTLSSPTTPVVTTANVWLSASLMYIRLSQVLPRFLSRAVSPVACTLIVVLFFQRDLFISRYVLIARLSPGLFFFFFRIYKKLCQITKELLVQEMSRSDSVEK